MSKNTFEGEFSSPEKEEEFLAITTEVKAGQFKDEEELTSISMSDVKKIGDSGFSDLSDLEELHLPKVEIIGNQCFLTAPIKTLKMPKIEKIGDECFSCIKSDSVLEFPNLKTIGNVSFSEVTAVSGLLAPKLEEVGDFVFCETPIEKLDLPNLKKLGEDAFLDGADPEGLQAILNRI